ncbi:hypothetical protein ACH5RR_017537 [Cinchona calisaya]|uniref:Uncharacterized protein n=1 Tax=Cinchona calisaya TaxID=153742 RepID=A0ABD2ZJ61_9GENT
MADAISSFGGPVTSTCEWCEKNYVYFSHIAEFFNTLSNIPCIVLALIGLVNSLRERFERRFSILHVSNMILGIWNVLYHATSYRVLHQSDETPVIWETLLYIYVLYSPDWQYRRTMPTFLVLYGAIFAVVHSHLQLRIGFKVHFVILCLLCIPRMYKYYLYTTNLHAKQVAKLYAVTLVVGTVCWLFDRVLCKESWLVNPQGHAMWHIFMGFNSYFANTFLMFCRAQQRGWAPRILHYFGILPYVKIRKPKVQ